jgi:transcriptional regulator with GAF, ATPase, and Fis domain
MALLDLIGSSAAFRALLNDVEMVARVDSAVLVQGETGTGKEMVARAIHDASPRRHNRFIAINCAAIPGALLESELFGHERGAFTGAVAQTTGRFQAADRGTLFLDEIGDLPIELQPKLLRVLQERQVERLGGSRALPVDARIIAATNQDLWHLVQERKFRADLYYRLNVFPITMPPLRERKDDIPLLLEHFIKFYCKRTGKTITKIDGNALKLCMEYNWPGNIRELQNVVERAVIVNESDTLFVVESWLRPAGAQFPTSQQSLSAFEVREVEMIESALAQSNGRVSGNLGAAVKLRIPRQTLESRMKRLGINKYGSKMTLTGSGSRLQPEAVSA